MTHPLYVVRDGKKLGPFSAAQLQALASAGRLRAEDAVWRNDMEHAVPVSRVKNLFLTPPPLPRPLEVAAAEVPLAAGAPVPSVSPSDPILAEVLPGDPLLAATGVMPGTSDEQALVAADAPAPLRADPASAAPSSQSKAGADSDTWSKPKMRRAVAVKGAVLLSQNGYNVQYRKKCCQCGCEDASRSTMLIGIGITRSHFFCPKCRKSREVQIQGNMQ
jgi:hypothetical protein